MTELRRRHVIRAGLAYGVFAWLVLQIADVLFPALRLPEWSMTLTVVLLLLGGIAILAFSWVFEITPEGIVRDSGETASPATKVQTGRRLNLLTITLALLALAFGIADRYFWRAPMAGAGTTAQVPDQAAPKSPASNADDAAARSNLVVAVLPFKSSGSEDGGFLASGLHDDLLSRLARLQAFDVISRTSMMEYADTTRNMTEIGAELGAAYILEGGVQARGNRVRINAQLIDAPADRHVWAETYDRELTADNLFDVQAELARAIATQLETKLNPADEAVMAGAPTRDTEAYAAYLQGLVLWNRANRLPGELGKVIAAFEAAVTADPQFALAWAWLAMANTALAQVTENESDENAAVEALDRARALKPGLIEADLAWADYLYRVRREYRQALQAIESFAREASSNTPTQLTRAWLLRRLGRYQEAYEVVQRARPLDPRNMQIVETLLTLAVDLGRCDEAEGYAVEGLTLYPDTPRMLAFAAEYELSCNGDGKRANEILRRIDIGVQPGWIYMIAFDAADAAGDALRLMELATDGLLPSGRWAPLREAQSRMDTAWALNRLDRHSESVEMLDAAGRELDGLEEKGDVSATFAYAITRMIYHAMRADPDETRRWAREAQQRIETELRGDVEEERFHLFNIARAYAIAGLEAEALEIMRSLLNSPGGRLFPYFDALPEFGGLKGRPEWAELEARYGNP